MAKMSLNYYIEPLPYIKEDFKYLNLPGIQSWLQSGLALTALKDLKELDNPMQNIKIRNYNTLLQLQKVLKNNFCINHIYPKIKFCDDLFKDLKKIYNLKEIVVMDEALLEKIEEKYKKELKAAKLPLSLKEFKLTNYKLNWNDVNLGDDYTIIFKWFLSMDLKNSFENNKIKDPKDFYWFLILYYNKWFIILIIEKIYYNKDYYYTIQNMLLVWLVFITLHLLDCNNNLKKI